MGAIVQTLTGFTSPYINRFLQPDMLIPNLASPQNQNRYSNVSNGPVNLNDPIGHILYEGVVNRTVVQNANGDWVVVTVGWGNNVIPGMDTANQVGGPILFDTVDAQMLLYIVTDQIFNP